MLTTYRTLTYASHIEQAGDLAVQGFAWTDSACPGEPGRLLPLLHEAARDGFRVLSVGHNQHGQPVHLLLVRDGH